MPAPLFPLKAIRAKCMDCSTTFKSVKYCTGDGLHSTRCELWPYRFGLRIPAAIRKIGAKFLDPKQMPDANENLDDLP